MKWILIVLFLAAMQQSYGQNNVPAKGQLLAERMAQRMRDSLDLNATERQKICEINLSLYKRKEDAWKSAGGNTNAIQKQLQQIENTRDAQYKEVLDAEKFAAYKQKKKFIISN